MKSVFRMRCRLPRRARALGVGKAQAFGALFVVLAVHSQMPDILGVPGTCSQAGESPDVVASDFYDVRSYGSVGDVSAFALGSVACNIGSCWVIWEGSSSNHPVIGQNMFRLKDGRFEQVGQSWVKHVFTPEQQPYCGSCSPGDATHLGVWCSDTYTAYLNGLPQFLGAKSEVNPYHGTFPHPNTTPVGAGNIAGRLQVHNSDLDPASNPGASYFAELQFVAPDDAAWHNDANNASWRSLVVTKVNASTYTIGLSGGTHAGDPAIRAWKVADPSVVETVVTVPGEGRFLMAAKATSLGGGSWRYEYALQNLNSHRAARSFSVRIPAGTIVSNVGFHDVDYHSGETLDGTDWSATVGAGSVVWSTQTYEQNANANALRWGTLYNFRLDANVPPGLYPADIGLFRAGAPSAVSASTVSPNLCNHNGTCEPVEDACQCLGDCSPSAESCSNGADDDCDGDADCADSDCPVPGAIETDCGDGADDDCDGLSDCLDHDCCASPACAAAPDADGDSFRVTCDCNDGNATVYPGAPQICDQINNDCLDPAWPTVPANEAQDADGDSHRACADCDDGNSQVWATPGEVPFLFLYGGINGATLFWSAAPGGSQTAVVYDVVRSTSARDLVTDAVCLPLSDPTNRSATDGDLPPPGAGFSYLVRGRDSCPQGVGSWGTGSNGQPRPVRPCP